jgi:type IV pilus assembly protein PilC
MKQRFLENDYLSAFCLELSLFLNAGITLSDGLHLLIEDDNNKKSLISKLAGIIDQNRPLSAALTDVNVFPDYMVNMILLGEKTGCLSDTLKSLSEYYDRQERLYKTIKNTLVYPTILLVMMIAVVVILITVVLPIFDNVFHQLGSNMPPFTIALMNFGAALSGAALVFAIIAAILIILGIILILNPSLRSRCVRFYRNIRKDRGLAAKIALARFSNALAMTIKSGLDLHEGFKMASALSIDSNFTLNKHKLCEEYLSAGRPLAEALSDSKIFPPVYGRMLSLGVKSGSSDTILDEIARRAENSVNDALEALLGRIEPTLVIIASLIVGVILLSVMLPLMNIMSFIG